MSAAFNYIVVESDSDREDDVELSYHLDIVDTRSSLAEHDSFLPDKQEIIRDANVTRRSREDEKNSHIQQSMNAERECVKRCE